MNEVGRAIAPGEMRVESSLPGDGELMARFGVSRLGLREALRTLAAMGLLEAAPRSAPGSCRNRAGTSSIVRPDLEAG
ncbi:MAG: GntR family transcriptional regulator [Tabrizicola sp.]